MQHVPIPYPVICGVLHFAFPWITASVQRFMIQIACIGTGRPIRTIDCRTAALVSRQRITVLLHSAQCG